MSGAANEPGSGDGPEQFVEIGLRRRVHARIGFGAEILDDDFLDMAVAAVQIVDRMQGFQPLLTRLANADENAGGEGDFQRPCPLQRFQPCGWVLVGRTVMRAAGLAQPSRRCFPASCLG